MFVMTAERRRLLRLMNGKMTVGQMARRLNKDVSSLSEKLTHMRLWGLVEFKQVGQVRYYSRSPRGELYKGV